MTTVVRQPAAGQDVWIAIDVSRPKWAFNVRWDGQEQRRLSTPGSRAHLEALVAQYPGCRLHVVYEACGFGYEIAWWCQQQGIAITVAPPSTVERAPGAFVKTDRLDASALNRKHEQGLLKSVYIPTRREHEQRQLSRTYGQLLRARSRPAPPPPQKSGRELLLLTRRTIAAALTPPGPQPLSPWTLDLELRPCCSVVLLIEIHLGGQWLIEEQKPACSA